MSTSQSLGGIFLVKVPSSWVTKQMLTPRASGQSKGKNEAWGIRRVGGGRGRALLIGEGQTQVGRGSAGG